MYIMFQAFKVKVTCVVRRYPHRHNPSVSLFTYTIEIGIAFVCEKDKMMVSSTTIAASIHLFIFPLKNKRDV